MQSSDDVMSQMKVYEGKVNAVRYERERTEAQQAHLRREEKRLTVLVSLGEATEEELAGVRVGMTTARHTLNRLRDELTMCEEAQAELERRLAEAKEREAEEETLAARVEYREAATEALRLLELLAVERARMERVGAHWWRNRYEGLGQASRGAVFTWPEQLRKDLRRLEHER